jgi:hypothetical protein
MHGLQSGIIKAAMLLFILPIVLFPDILGNFIGHSGLMGGGRMIDQKSPSSVISFLGWCGLIGFIVLNLT